MCIKKQIIANNQIELSLFFLSPKNHVETCSQNMRILYKQKHKRKYDEMYIQKQIVANNQPVSMSLFRPKTLSIKITVTIMETISPNAARPENQQKIMSNQWMKHNKSREILTFVGNHGRIFDFIVICFLLRFIVV